MAEAMSKNALVPVEGEYMLEIKEFDAAGHTQALQVAAPTTPTFKQWTLLQQVAMLKRGGWSNSPVHEIMFAVAYADSLGLDVMRGDVFPTGGGRLGISNKAKIKLALATGNIVGIQTEITDTKQPINLVGCAQKTDLECKVTVHVKGWVVPIVRRARLSAWFNAKNPNWAGRPEHMLELNTVAHAVEFVNPVATESDEAPPVLDTAGEVKTYLNQAITEVEKEKQ